MGETDMWHWYSSETMWCAHRLTGLTRPRKENGYQCKVLTRQGTKGGQEGVMSTYWEEDISKKP